MAGISEPIGDKGRSQLAWAVCDSQPKHGTLWKGVGKYKEPQAAPAFARTMQGPPPEAWTPPPKIIA